jgi:hypothetical protein
VWLFERLDYFDPKRGAKIMTFISGNTTDFVYNYLRRYAITHRAELRYLSEERKRLKRQLR